MSEGVSMSNSSLGQKYLMAVTGLIGYGFVIGHILGNLLIFAGPDALNSYAAALRELPFGGLWIARVVLLSAVIGHVVLAIKLAKQNRKARPSRYAVDASFQATKASMSMLLSGLLILAYIFYHLAHFTWRVVAYAGPYTDALGRDDVYRMVVESFQQPVIALTYIIAMVLVGLHLRHGSHSMFQSLGINHPRYNRLIRLIPPVIGGVVAFCGLTIPVAVLLGVIG